MLDENPNKKASHNDSTVYFEERQQNFRKVLQSYQALGYEPLIFRNLNKEIADKIGTQFIPSKAYKVMNDFSMGERIGICLFGKDSKLYFQSHRKMLLEENPPLPILIKDGCFIYVVVLVETEGGEILQQLQLRMRNHYKSGHTTLVLQRDWENSVVGAGQVFVQDGRVISADNQTGGFFEILKRKQVAPDVVMAFLQPYADHPFHEFITEENLAAALLKAGYKGKIKTEEKEPAYPGKLFNPTSPPPEEKPEVKFASLTLLSRSEE